MNSPKTSPSDNKSAPQHNAQLWLEVEGVRVQVLDGETFNAGLPPEGRPAAGTLFTEDVDALYAKTVSYEVNTTIECATVLFFDEGSTLLGQLQAETVSTVPGILGGKGRWS